MYSLTPRIYACSLAYDINTNTYSTRPGIEIDAYGWGETCRVEYLLASLLEAQGEDGPNADDEEMAILQNECGFHPVAPDEYFHTFVQYFVDRGYVRGKTIRAAPYDWRLSAGEHLHIIRSTPPPHPLPRHFEINSWFGLT